MGISPASFSAAGSNDLSGPTVLLMTEYKVSQNVCTAWICTMSEDWCDSQLDQTDWLSETNSLDGVGLTTFGRLNYGVGYGYGGRTMEAT